MKTILALFLSFFLSCSLFAQVGNVGIGTTNPDSSAVLDITSTDKGVLLPRMDSTNRKNIINPKNGLLVYDSTANSFWFFRDSIWAELLEINNPDNLGNHIATQVLNLGNNKITNLANPTLANDASNKSYVDGSISPLISDILDNSTDIVNNETSIDNNTDIITGNTNDITTNVANITTNSANIFNNTLAINTHNTNDNDLSSTNELQTLSISGQDLSISGGNTISLPSSNNVFENNTGVVRNTGANTDDFVFGDSQLPQNGNTVTENLFFFDESKGAFRAGKLFNSNAWATDSIGIATIGLGNNPKATGLNAIALGNSSKASSNGSIAIGTLTKATGYEAVAIGSYNEAKGDNSTALGYGTLATGTNSTTLGSNTYTLGINSFASGAGSTAIGSYASAMGNNSFAKGTASIAMGHISESRGDYSTAFGNNTLASGNKSTAFGFYTDAEAYNSMAIGRYNIGGGQTISWVETDPLFEIGNGTNLLNPSNAFTVYKNGVVAFENYTFPEADGTINQVMKTDGAGQLSWTDESDNAVFENNSGVVRNTGANTDNFVFGDSQLPPNGVNVTENLFFFDENKSAFRVGQLSNSPNWSPDSIGLSSFAAGYNTKAIGPRSSVFGLGSITSGLNSFAAGSYNAASGSSSFSVGHTNSALGNYSVAMGSGCNALGETSISIGNNAAAQETGVAIGNNVTAIYGATAIGRFNIGLGNHSAWVETQPVFEIGIGADALNKANAVTVLKNGTVSFKDYTFPNIDGNADEILLTDGSGNISWGIPKSIEDTEGDTDISFNNVDNKILFTTNNIVTAKIEEDSMYINGSLKVGAGAGAKLYIGNAFLQSSSATILKSDANFRPNLDDTYDLGASGKRWDNIYATNTVIQTSDRRLKKNIIPIVHGLKSVLKMKPVQYNWNKELDSDKPHLGLIAQELVKLIPEAVSEPKDKDDYYGVKYAELVPVLIKAIKEQNVTIKSQEMTLSNVQDELSELKKMVAELVSKTELIPIAHQVININSFVIP